MVTCAISVWRCVRFGAAILVLASGPAWAQTAAEAQRSMSGHWRVQLAVGEVNWRGLPLASGDDPWHPVQSGTILAPPAEIETAVNGRIELWRGEDRIQAGPDTRLTL